MRVTAHESEAPAAIYVDLGAIFVSLERKRRFCPIDFWGSGGFSDVRIFRETATSLEGP